MAGGDSGVRRGVGVREMLTSTSHLMQEVTYWNTGDGKSRVSETRRQKRGGSDRYSDSDSYTYNKKTRVTPSASQ